MSEELMLEGTVEDIVYRNPENGYCVINISQDRNLVTAVGIIPACNAGEKVRLYGRWKNHPTFGTQFSAERCERSMPESAADMLRYLSGGSIKGIGPATANKIVDRFGDRSFEILDKFPERLSEIRGISREKALEMGKSFRNEFAARQVIIALEKWGLSASESLTAYKVFGSSAVERINENPYILCSEKMGLRFERVDEIAASFHVRVKDIFRHRAGILHILRHNLSNGHTCVPREKLIIPAAELLGTEREETQQVIDDLIEDRELVQDFFEEKPYIFLTEEYIDEKALPTE